MGVRDKMEGRKLGQCSGFSWQLCGDWSILQKQGVQVVAQTEGIVVAGNDTFYLECVAMEILVETQRAA